MHKILALAVLAALPALAACHTCEPTETRFWEVKDAATGATGYVVDTANVGFEGILVKYVDHAGRYVAINDISSKRAMTEAEWNAATNGTDWSLRYCGVRKACWASVD